MYIYMYVCIYIHIHIYIYMAPAVAWPKCALPVALLRLSGHLGRGARVEASNKSRFEMSKDTLKNTISQVSVHFS